MKDEKIQSLEEQLSRTRELLNHTVDTLEEERRIAAATKNKVPGGYYMMSRAAEKNLRAIQRDNPTAALVFSVIREHMQLGTNALTISQAALCKILGSSRTTIYRASKYLTENNYVQLIKTGNVATYVVNEQIAFAGNAGDTVLVFAPLMARPCSTSATAFLTSPATPVHLLSSS